MIDIALDSSGDLLIENYDLNVVENIDQVAQNLAIRLRFFLNEWFLDITQGLPYYQEILIKSPNQIRVESLIKNEILETEGINELLSFSSTYDEENRKFSVAFTANTDDNQELNLEVELP